MKLFTQALAGIVPAWRDLCDRRLPLWTMLGRRARSLRRLEAIRAQLRCERCHLQPRCRRRLAAKLYGPARGCPNVEFFF